MPVLLPGGSSSPVAAPMRAAGGMNWILQAWPWVEGVAEAFSGSKPSPGYRRYSKLYLAFFFRAISSTETGSAAEA